MTPTRKCMPMRKWTDADQARYDAAARATSTVSALLPRTFIQDDGGGPYVVLGPEAGEGVPTAFVITDNPVGEPGARPWQYQSADNRTVVASKTLTDASDTAKVIAWLASIGAIPRQEGEA